MVATQEVVRKATDPARKYRSPHRILARAFRLARDKWKRKYMGHAGCLETRSTTRHRAR
jgi:hypothetical protein